MAHRVLLFGVGEALPALPARRGRSPGRRPLAERLGRRMRAWPGAEGAGDRRAPSVTARNGRGRTREAGEQAPDVDRVAPDLAVAGRGARRRTQLRQARPRSRPRAGRSSRSSRARSAGQIAPQPVRVTGPRQGSPRVTTTHAMPRRLHSRQTAWSGSCGRRPVVSEVSSSTSWCGSIGQPRSSASTVHVVRHGPCRGERLHERRHRVDGGSEGLVLGGRPQRLDAAGGRARPDHDEQPSPPPAGGRSRRPARASRSSPRRTGRRTGRRSGATWPRRTRRTRSAR